MQFKCMVVNVVGCKGMLLLLFFDTESVTTQFEDNCQSTVVRINVDVLGCLSLESITGHVSLPI